MSTRFADRLTHHGGSPFSRSIQLLDNARGMGRELRPRAPPLGVAVRCAFMEEEVLPIPGESRTDESLRCDPYVILEETLLTNNKFSHYAIACIT